MRAVSWGGRRGQERSELRYAVLLGDKNSEPENRARHRVLRFREDDCSSPELSRATRGCDPSAGSSPDWMAAFGPPLSQPARTTLVRDQQLTSMVSRGRGQDLIGNEPLPLNRRAASSAGNGFQKLG